MRSYLLLALVACSSNPVTSDAGDAQAPMDAAPLPGFALGVGEVAELAVQDGVAGEQLQTPTGMEKFVVIVASTRFDGSKTPVTYSIATDGATSMGATAIANKCSITSDAFANKPLPSETPPSGSTVMVGAQKTVHMPLPNGGEDITVQAVAVGKVGVVWADVTQAHPANLDMTFATQFLTDFDDVIMPRERVVFGIESDFDKDGHIHLIFTPLTYQTAVAFFTQCDLQQICSTYNGGEYLYLTPPNAIPPPYNTANAIKETLAHETGHLVHFNRKVIRNNLSAWTDSGYMIEGVGGFAQDVIGYQAGNLYVAKAGLDSIQQFSLAETLVDKRPYDTKRDGVLRGGSYWFVRWYYDRGGGDLSKMDGTIETKGGPVFLRTLLDSKVSIAKELPNTTGSSIEDIATDFYTALLASNRTDLKPKNACFAFNATQTDPITMRQRGGDTHAKFAGGMMEMTGPVVQTTADGQILPGGVEYVAVDAISGQKTLDLTVTADATAKPRVRVLRVR